MSLTISLSQDFISRNLTVVDNIFIKDHLPGLKDERLIKVYLYALYMAAQGGFASPCRDKEALFFSDGGVRHDTLADSYDVLAELCRGLKMESEEVCDVLAALVELGLLELKNPSEPGKTAEYKFINLRKSDDSVHTVKKYDSAKYARFNTALQALFPDYMIASNEYSEYYDEIESLGIPPETALITAEYCVNIKGASIGRRYIFSVLRDWVRNGVKSPDSAQKKIAELEAQSGDIREVFAALGRKSAPDYSDRELLSKWKALGLSLPAIIAAAKRCKSKGGISKLDGLLSECARSDKLSPLEVEEYLKNRDKLFELAVAVNKKIGVYYESLDNVVETYIRPWKDYGFDDEAIIAIAQHCMEEGARRLSDMNSLLLNFRKAGCLDTASVLRRISAVRANDGFILRLYAALELQKNITKTDRGSVNLWLSAWGLSEDLILFAAKTAKDKAYPFTYLNQLLSRYKDNGVKTPDEAARIALPKNKKTAKPQKDYSEQREYSKEELDALFDL